LARGRKTSKGWPAEPPAFAGAGSARDLSAEAFGEAGFDPDPPTDSPTGFSHGLRLASLAITFANTKQIDNKKIY
jgi:hypothetical protein